MYELRSENLTHLGGPMGSEYTYDNWRKHFTKIEFAKEYAEKDYLKKNNNPEKIKWVKEYNHIRTQDLGFVMYYITPIKCKK